MAHEERIAHMEAELARERAEKERLLAIVESLSRATSYRPGAGYDPRGYNPYDAAPLIRMKTPAERAEAEEKAKQVAETSRIRAQAERRRRDEERAAKRAAARVYFIQQDGSEGLVKIGTTTRAVEVRLKELQAGHSCSLVVRAHAPGGRQQESDLHWRFASLRVSGEWFRSGPDLMAYIALVADRGML